MKKLRIAIIALMIALIAMPVFAKATKKVNRPVIIDYQGATLDKEIPHWVEVLVEGDNAKVEKELDLHDVKSFIVENRGPELTMLKSWTDLVSVESEVAGQIERQVAQSVQATMEGQQNVTEAEIQQAISLYSGSLKNVTINNLEKKASFWIKTQAVKPGLKKAKRPEDYIVEYTYYVVYVCPMKDFQRQIDAALADVETNTDQAAMLKEMLTNKLRETVTVGVTTQAN
ncbi:MAG: hypothetical protein K5839_08465 [Treponemataceae bacterium]|nr:hypothetical protein [Treponemataceae bacterium]